MQQKYLAEIAGRFATPVVQLPLLPHEVKGLEMLTELGETVYGTGRSAPATRWA
jgi:anion-transporting  ArsA/GET3 family ATPase